MRLELKFHEKVIDHFTKATHEIIEELKSPSFQDIFQLIFSRTQYQPNIIKQSTSNFAPVKQIIANNMVQYKRYLYCCAEDYTRDVLISLLDRLTVDLIETIASIFTYDMNPSNIKRRTFRKRLQKISQTTLLKFHQDILNSILRNIRPSSIDMNTVIESDYLSNSNQSVFDPSHQSFVHDTQDFSQENNWSKFRLKTGKQFCIDLKKLDKSHSAAKKYINPNILDDCTKYVMVAIRSIYKDAPTTKDNSSSGETNVQDALDKCIYYLTNIIPLIRAKLNEAHIMNPDWWPITSDMVHVDSSSDNITNDYARRTKEAILKRGPTDDLIKVNLRRLSGDFCAAHVRLQKDSIGELRHPNILHHHGAYCTDDGIIIVTEPWKMTLREAVTSGSVRSLNLRLQVAIELTELCLDMKLQLSAEQLTPDTIVITQDNQIKVNIATMKPQSYFNFEYGGTRTANHMNISRALGTIFKFLFTDTQDENETIPSLCLLIKRCCDEMTEGYSKPPTLEEVLSTLKFEQVT